MQMKTTNVAENNLAAGGRIAPRRLLCYYFSYTSLKNRAVPYFAASAAIRT